MRDIFSVRNIIFFLPSTIETCTLISYSINHTESFELLITCSYHEYAEDIYHLALDRQKSMNQTYSLTFVNAEKYFVITDVFCLTMIMGKLHH